MNAIQIYMEKNGVGVSEIAEATGLNYHAVWRHSNGTRGISVKSAKVYSDKLGINLHLLLPELFITSPPLTAKDTKNAVS